MLKTLGQFPQSRSGHCLHMGSRMCHLNIHQRHGEFQPFLVNILPKHSFLLLSPCVVGSTNSLQKSREGIQKNCIVPSNSGQFHANPIKPRQGTDCARPHTPRTVFNSGNLHGKSTNSIEGFNIKVLEKNRDLDITFQRIKHQMQSDLENRINAIKRENSEALEKGKMPA